MPIKSLHEGREINPKALLLGHVRLGVFTKGHPSQSSTFVFTSSDAARLRPLAQDFGGTIENYVPQGAGGEEWRLVSQTDAFTALFPFADETANLSQSFELWTRSGLQRKCDGFDATVFDRDEESGEVGEAQASCICALMEKRECSAATRLRLLIPQTGLGLWELTTNSVIAAEQLYDQVRFISELAGDRMNRLPIRVVYAPRELSYFDPKENKRRKTTKRIVSLSIAGDAERALAPLGMTPDRGLLAAVASALEDSGRELSLPGGEGTRSALPSQSPASDPADADDPEPDRTTETEGGEDAAPGGTQTRAASPPAGGNGDKPANPDHWGRATAVGLTAGNALRRARELWPNAGIRSASAITKDQLATLIDEAMR